MNNTSSPEPQPILTIFSSEPLIKFGNNTVGRGCRYFRRASTLIEQPGGEGGIQLKEKSVQHLGTAGRNRGRSGGLLAGPHVRGKLKMLSFPFSLHRMKPSTPLLLIACLVMSLNSYTQQVPHCVSLPGSEKTVFICNASSLHEFPKGFPSETKTISVQSTQISGLDAEALQGLPELQELYLTNNQLKTLPGGLFRNLPHLHYLNLSRNLLEDLPPALFANAGNLTYLALGGNQLAELRRSWFDTLGDLKTLHLEHNQLKEIPDSCFQKLTLLTFLDLSSNLLRCLSPEMFRGLTFLTALLLENNPIKSIAPNTFHGTPKLKMISLRNSSLTHVPPGLFRFLRYLQWLDLSSNEIASLDSPLVSWSFGLLLKISGNPWACDCRLQALFDWFREDFVLLFPNLPNVVCAFPRSLKGQIATSLNRSQLCAS
ncbi:PREDICTED: phospholipase A2 inhibitor-like [Thamnophis sirtalis]|uniref:Phospholipase A2 inhibitor-like n=1 Tax=Thamnophis sirtalis TaxID=35019 RepID=A0A6I9Z7A2_9SAUR|nr:PREDICTED: phospholipase A2 inhibitor-like [Thamnophis sirtalis]